MEAWSVISRIMVLFRAAVKRVGWYLVVPRLVSLYLLGGIEPVNRYLLRTSEYRMWRILRLFGAKIGYNLSCKHGVVIDNALQGYKNLRIGDNCYLGLGVFLDMVRPIVIEDEAVVSAKVIILTHGDVGNRLLSKYVSRKEGEVHLGRGCWIGAGSIILPGVTVGEGAIVGAGAVVSHDIPPYSVAVGVPAKTIKRLKDK